MPIAQQDTEITLGTGRMLALFFTFVLVCAVFFAIGFSLGRKTSFAGTSSVVTTPASGSAAVIRPSAAKQNETPAQPQSTDFSFYKSVGAKSTDTQLTPQEAQQQPPAAATETPAPSTVSSALTTGYFVQVAAVSRQEDAESLVDALKKKQYPAFSSTNLTSDKFYHVQVGPYAELKEAEAMRARLITDGYNPIVKK
jgi:DedD protein